MKVSFADGAAARAVVRSWPSFRDFVDAALFDPRWGYYSTGNVRFGEGGHYDTFPLALAPMFGRMVAQYAFRRWRRLGRPVPFEICELGAGNGQLALDVLLAVHASPHMGSSWRRFASATRYRVIERSPALIERQRAQLGPLGGEVTWVRGDLARHALKGTPFAAAGVMIANEVLDCLPHHKIVPHPSGTAGVVFVASSTPGGDGGPPDSPATAALIGATGRGILTEAPSRHAGAFREVAVPVTHVPRLRGFLRRHYPEFLMPAARFAPYFACPAIEVMIRNAAQLYGRGDYLWIDYGDLRDFHLRSAERERLFAGVPRSGASVYRAPGSDDVTFMVDFSVAVAAARAAGLRVEYYGSQSGLARYAGVGLDRPARDLILRYRTLSWLLAVAGVGPERDWRRGALTWHPPAGRGGRLRTDVDKAIAEFMGRRASTFKLLILRRHGSPSRRAATP